MDTDADDHEWQPEADEAPAALDLDAVPAEDLAGGEALLAGLHLDDEQDRFRARLRLAAHHQQDEELTEMFDRGEQMNDLEWHLIAARLGRRAIARVVALALVERSEPD